MAKNRRYLDGDGGDQPKSELQDPFMGYRRERADLPDINYGGTPNESLAFSRSKGHLATAEMNPNNGPGDINEGVSYRTRMAGQAPENHFEDDING